jgi:hypothetical protein
LILLIYGAAWILSLTLGISLNGQLVGPLIAIAIGILILAGAIYRLSHRS